MSKQKKIKGLSLFSNVGVSEALLDEAHAQVVIANEIDAKRCKFYQNIYPETKVICGDVREVEVYNSIISESTKNGVDFILATPPCQGMSTAGKQHSFDERNQLIYHAIKIIKNVKPKYVLIENVPQQLRTFIKVHDTEILIPNYVKKMLEDDYFIEESIINTADYGVPQIRKRSIFLLTRKDVKVLFKFLSDA